MGIKWAAITGEWTFGDDSATYDAPEAGPTPEGLALSSLRLQEGKVHVTVRLHTTTDTTGNLVIGYRSRREPYLLVQLGAWGAAYAMAAWSPDFGWRCLERAGLAKNLQVGQEYDVAAEIRGGRLRMNVDGVDVLERVETSPLAGMGVGLSAYGARPVEFSRFRLSDEVGDEHRPSVQKAPSNPASFEIEGALRRALRVAFQGRPPTREREVQDATEVILRTLALPFTREKESAQVGPRGFTPDFVIATEDLAIEVKLTTGKHGPGLVQEEIAADVAGYSTKWRHALFVIYDLGVIDDPERMRLENMQKFGATVLIIKH